MEFIKTKSIVFGPCVTHVLIEFDATGNPTKSASLIYQYQSLTLKHLQRAAHKRFRTPLAVGAAIPASSTTSLWNECIIDPALSDPVKDTLYNCVNGAVVAQCMNTQRYRISN
jgi:hypothetical protein